MAIDIDSLPAFGEYQGKLISREDAAELPAAVRGEVVFDVPGEGRIRPWRYVSDGATVTVSGNKISF